MKMANQIRLKYILDVLNFDSPFCDRFVHDFAVIEQDPEVDVVVETIGGAKAALDFTRRALSEAERGHLQQGAGGDPRVRAAAAGQGKERRYLFEASVGGGIPLSAHQPVRLAANELTGITGILNGTTNYILTRMIRAGCLFEEALKEAQTTAMRSATRRRISRGWDACRKICILASLALAAISIPNRCRQKGSRGSRWM